MLFWLRLPQAIFGELRLFFDLLIVVAFISIAVISRSGLIFLGAWLSVSVYNTFIIAADAHLSRRMKLKLILVNPLLFPLHIGMTLLNVIAAFKMLAHWKELIGLAKASGSWVPPDRIGREQLS